ncbi:sugar phosphate isomerase/epimerase [Flavobacterium sp. SUN052]|uniref:sugar phosphate isomerase/epimerase family protein n=1 Tax=Flavobacterium sp. SUN052 TaxID=3002441 RepID=UPI00237E46ED|nr:sugar phosphate isomerase/epimerase [Flavobacterium sp. SUN052]MEC4003746.1 sugar phosphate isomerase/epimerase [Flavobacterium sp. SUN052]
MDRRKFITRTAQATALLAVLPNIACASTTNGSGIFNEFGIQLWTLRDIIYANPQKTIAEVGKMGFTQIESFEGEKGIFWGMKPAEFKSFLDGEGLKLISSHCNWQIDLARKADEVASVGGKYLMCPWLGPQKSIDDFKSYADKFNKAGEICKKAGIKFAYHNHDYSFKELDGQIPQQVMMDLTDANLVDFEMDMYWVVTAGINPIEYMTKYKNRFQLCHIKDRIKDAKEPFASCTLGEGSIDYAKILKEAKALNMKYFIYEQEKYDDKGVLFDAEQSAAYLKKLKK